MQAILTNLAEKLGQHFKAKQLMLVTAESCTGGGLGYWITSIPGSSDWYDRGFITYSNAAKMDMLGVNTSTLDRFGAVSAETALEMATGALKNSRADVSIAITASLAPTGERQKNLLAPYGLRLPVSSLRHKPLL